MATEVDELYSVKTAYWLGNFDEVIQEARAARVKTEPLKVERDVFMWRAHLALGQFDAVLEGIKDEPATPLPLQAVKLLATFLSAPPKGREVALLQAEDWLADAGASANPVLQLVAGTMHMHQGDVAAALTAIKGGGSNLETCVWRRWRRWCLVAGSPTHCARAARAVDGRRASAARQLAPPARARRTPTPGLAQAGLGGAAVPQARSARPGGEGAQGHDRQRRRVCAHAAVHSPGLPGAGACAPPRACGRAVCRHYARPRRAHSPAL